MTKKLKSFLQNDQHFFGLLLIVAACASFYLGRLSVAAPALQEAQNTVVITTAPRVEVAESNVLPAARSAPTATEAGFVASKSGTKYHRTDCPGASQIKPENIVRFATAAAAEAAGYTPAANCPGL